jgi:hypothetical protein
MVLAPIARIGGESLPLQMREGSQGVRYQTGMAQVAIRK